jgi:hypothetical protein
VKSDRHRSSTARLVIILVLLVLAILALYRLFYAVPPAPAPKVTQGLLFTPRHS